VGRGQARDERRRGQDSGQGRSPVPAADGKQRSRAGDQKAEGVQRKKKGGKDPKD
jgi:hypothetical protein